NSKIGFGDLILLLRYFFKLKVSTHPSVMSFVTAKLGAKVAHALSPQMLKKCFACLLVVVGSYFIYKGFMN
ncbi:sulfite exporter TauE/SafE family protein, partial [Acinetobacter baumannii]|nr:sulfite exporter TauE/SafE family protein [Acinetobacter baumannii]